MSPEGRRGVRRARKLGVEVVRDSGGDQVPAFCEMLPSSFDRRAERTGEPKWPARHRGTRRDPRHKCALLSGLLGDGFRLYVACHEGRPAAAILVLVGAGAHYARGVMDAAVGGKTNAADLLHWTAVQDAWRDGCRVYHMGESAPGSSPARCKQKLGARLVPYAEYAFERLPVTRADRRLSRVAKPVMGIVDA
jgi:hypothetical protein